LVGEEEGGEGIVVCFEIANTEAEGLKGRRAEGKV